MKHLLELAIAWTLFIVCVPFLLANKLCVLIFIWPFMMVTDGIKQGTVNTFKLLLSKGQ